MGLKKKEAKLRKVKCSECDAINIIQLPRLGGTITFFCNNCGAEIHLIFDRTILDMELKRPSTQHEN